jgi:hypothetical protein
VGNAEIDAPGPVEAQPRLPAREEP